MPIRFGFIALALSLTLAGCGDKIVEESDCPDDGTKSVEGEQFAALYAEAYCDLRSDCYPDEFVDEFENLEGCQRAVSKREIADDCDGCTLDSDIGDECIQAAKTVSCTDWADEGALEAACDERWDCSDAE